MEKIDEAVATVIAIDRAMCNGRISRSGYDDIGIPVFESGTDYGILGERNTWAGRAERGMFFERCSRRWEMQQLLICRGNKF